MKNTIARPLAALLPLALIFTSFVPAQSTQPPARQTPPPQQSPAQTKERRPVRESSASASALVERNGASAPARAVTRGSIEGDIGEALSVIEDKYVDADDLDKPDKTDKTDKSGERLKYDNLVKSSVIGMLRSLDPHSNYYDPKEFEELTTEQRSEYYGIGASIINRRRGDQIDTYVTATFPDSPAYKAGLRFGDRIVAVDDAPMRGKSSAEVRDKIRGPRNSKVRVTVERATTDKPETLEITRDRVDQPSVPDAYMLRPGVGYIDMTRGFNTTTAAELENALDYLRAPERGMTQLVLDLRDNPGGFLEQSVRVAEKFLGRGQRILTQRGREGERSYDSRNLAPDQTPLVVLVSRSSASASEIVAGALQDHDRALIVGENSFGKGLVQSIIRIDTGEGVAGLTLTSAKYYTPSGRLIQRDYSSGSTYDYYTRGGLRTRNESAAPQQQQQARPNGPESRTDSGRVVYGGGGISPDEPVPAREFEPSQARFIDPIFFFARDLANNRVAGFPAYNVQRPIDFEHSLRPTDLPVTDELFAAFKKYVAANPAFKITPAQIDRQAAFVRRQLRYDIVTAAYGTIAAQRVLVQDDPQVARAVQVMPRARELALNAQRARAARRGAFQP